MLRCQALRPAPCAGLRAVGVRPARLRSARVTCNAPSDGLPSGPGGPSGKPKPSSSRRSASRGEVGQSEQERLESAVMQPPFSAGGDGEANGGAPAVGAASGSHPQAAAAGSAMSEEDAVWESWRQYFYEMDDVVQELDALEADLEDAVRREDYRAAAEVKAQIVALEQKDSVGAALAELDAAVAEERFGDAARLRDETGAGLLGWWVGRGEGDVVGHLLRVNRDFGRLAGTVYTARDLADVIPSLQSRGDARLAAAAALLSRSPGDPEEPEPLKPDDVGLPVLEFFLRRAPEGSGRQWEQQVVALYAPEEAVQEAAAEMEEDAVASTIAEFIASDNGGSVVSVERGQSEDGSAYVTIEIGPVPNDSDDDGEQQQGVEIEEDVQAASADYHAASDDDDINTIDELAASVGVPGTAGAAGGSSSGSQASASASSSDRGVDSEEEERLRQWRQQAAGEPEGEEGGAGGSGRVIPEEVDALTAALLAAGEAARQQWDEPGEGEDAEHGVETPSAASQLGSFLQRTPAQIVWEGRDRFTVTVQEPAPFARQRQQQELDAAAAVAAAAAPQLQRPPVRIIYDGKEQMRQRQQQEAEQQELEEQDGDEGSRPQQPQQPQAQQQQQEEGEEDAQSGNRRLPDGSTDVEVTAEESDSEDVSVMLSAQQGQAAQQAQQRVQQQWERDQQADQDAVAEDSAALAEQIEAVREELQAGRKPSKDAINEIARRAMGLAIHQGLTSANQAGAALAERWAAMEGSTQYERLPLSYTKTDPFDGLYIGSFGPHGPELLRVTRQWEGGKEWAVATKLTGDPNVPAGNVSWKALIGRSERQPVEIYPPEMAVTARYKGLGQVAQHGFTNPKWVEGELLVFGSDSALVGGAQLGFTYDVQKSQRYLVVLHRVHLDEVFPEQEFP